MRKRQRDATNGIDAREDEPTVYRSRRSTARRWEVKRTKARREQALARTSQMSGEPGAEEPTIDRSRRWHLPRLRRRGGGIDGVKIKKHRRWKPVLLITVISLVVILLGLGIWGYFWLNSKESRMREPDVAQALDPKQPAKPETTLIIGVDKGSVPGDNVSRSDILMLAMVNPSGQAAVISIPRDTRTLIAGHRGYNKINAAHAFGGTKLTIETVKQFTGLDINHFVEIDFQGFKDIVNAMGGVKMHVDTAIHDKYAGDVPAGDVILNGDMTLALVRARHDVHAVPNGDLDRVTNQRKVLQAMLSDVSHIRDPFKLMNVVDAVSKNMKTDMSFWGMFSLGRRMKGGNLTMASVPGTPRTIGGIWYYDPDVSALQSMLSSFESKQEVAPATEKQADVTDGSGRSGMKVAVLNGSGVKGLAGTVASQLESAGYASVKTGNATKSYDRTTVYYAPGNGSNAGLVAADLKGATGATQQASSTIASTHGADVVVVLGRDYRH